MSIHRNLISFFLVIYYNLEKFNIIEPGRFIFKRQEDAHEYIRSFVELLAEQENRFIKNAFQGGIRSQIICLECGYKSNNFSPVLDFSLEICDSVELAIHEFTKTEFLYDGNMYYCAKLFF